VAQPARQPAVRDHNIGTTTGDGPSDSLSRAVWGSRPLEVVRSSPAGLMANDHHERGLDLAAHGFRTGDSALLKQAIEEFEAALQAAPTTNGAVAFRRRVTINIAILHRRFGQPENAALLLEEVRRNLTGDLDWRLEDAPRTLNSLGNVYAVLGRTADAIDAYQQAQRAVERTRQGRTQPDRIRLYVQILSNLASAYLDEGKPDKALTAAAQAHQHLALAPEPLIQARTGRVQGLAHYQLGMELNGWSEAQSHLIEAIKLFEDARQTLHRQDAIADWAEVTGTLAGVEASLGNLQAGRDSEQDRTQTVEHLRRAITLYSEALPGLKRDEDQDAILKDRNEALKYLSNALVSLLQITWTTEISWLALLARISHTDQ
jgi:tetratricopeptide (TPR) repeat protein